MPRRRPGALRAEQACHPGTTTPVQINGLSLGASLAIHRVESRSSDDYLFTGAARHALRRYRAFLRPPGHRPLYPQYAECSCPGCSFDDVTHARDVLEFILDRLPPRARTELTRLLKPLDTRYLMRTLPDPFGCRRPRYSMFSRRQYWWHRRLTRFVG